MKHTLHTLKNGIKVVLVPHKDSASATVCVFYAVGSRYESQKLWGATHFIEHMMFKGTEKRPNSLAISRELDGVGAEYNAFTGKDNTCYYIRLRADKLPMAIEMLEDMLHHSKFGEKEIDAERGAIGEEVRMYEDNPVMLVDELIEEELYDGSTLARKIAGTVPSLAKMGHEELVGHHKQYYIPSRMVIAIAGKFEEVDVLNDLEESFGLLVEPKKKPRSFEALKPGVLAPSKKQRIRIVEKSTEQVQLAVAFPSYGFDHPKLAVGTIIANILGGSMSSRLFIEVREKRGLAYSIRASTGPYQDTGSFVIQAGIAKGRVTEALSIVAKELLQLTKKPVGKEELRRIKENMKGRLALSFEDSSNLADWYGRKLLLTGKVMTPEEYIARFEKVTAEDIMRVAKEMFRKKNVCIAAIGELDKSESLIKPFDILQ